jgi:imidazolonepropionase-like amidohydrolase
MIIAVGPADEVLIPQGAQVIDGEGLYLMPGLADMHIHTRQDWTSDDWPVSPLVLYLANGVTTVRDFGPQGEDIDYALRWRDEIEAGTRDGPTIYASGTILFASPLEDPAGIVRENHNLGFDFLKLYSYLSVDDFRAAMVMAKELDMYTAGHIPYAVGLELALAEGLEEIAHVEELLFEFLEFDQDQALTSNEWLSYIIETAEQQLEYATDFEDEEFEA